MQFKITSTPLEPKSSSLPAPNAYTAAKIKSENWPQSPVVRTGTSYTYDYNHPLAMQIALEYKRYKKLLFTSSSELPSTWQDCAEIIEELTYRIESGEDSAHALYTIVATHCNALAKERIYRTDLSKQDSDMDLQTSTELPKLVFKMPSTSTSTVEGAKLFVQNNSGTNTSKTITEETPATIALVEEQIKLGITDVEKLKKITRVSRFIIRKVLSNAK